MTPHLHQAPFAESDAYSAAEAVSSFGPALAAIRTRWVLVGFSVLLCVVYLIAVPAVVSVAPMIFGVQHPMSFDVVTGVCLFLMALSMLYGGLFNAHSRIQLGVSVSVLSISLLRLFEVAFLAEAPLSALVASDEQLRDSYGHMAPPTAASLLLLSLGSIVRKRYAQVAYVLTVAAAFPPSVAFLDFVLQGQMFFSEMGLLTCLILLLLAIAQFLLFIRTPLLRHLFADSPWGRFARRQLFFTVVGIVILAGVTRTVMPEAGLAIEVMAIGAIWFTVLIVLSNGPRHERAEHARRMVERDLHRQSIVDPLTGLMNRRGVYSYIKTREGTSCEETLGTVLIMADLDDFKRVNDRFGHDMGDHVLRMVASLLRSRLRSFDLVSRWGGEEFVMVLANKDLSEGLAAAEEICEAIAREVTWTHAGQSYSLTASLGVACLEPNRDVSLKHRFQDALEAADSALFRAKAAGRNKVILDAQAYGKQGATTALSSASGAVSL